MGVGDDDLPGLLFFNLLNPKAARANVLQQASNQLVLVEALRNLSSASSPVSGADLRVDPTKVSASGHSQGAQTLPLVAASDPALAAVVSSSGSGGYYHQFAHAADKRALMARLTGDIDQIDELNPLVHVAQTVLDAADPANYPSGVNYLNVAGRVDGCVSVESSRHFAQATGLVSAGLQDPVSLYGSASLDPPTTVLPASGSAGGPTRVNLETAGGHFVAMYDPAPGTAFLTSVEAGTTPSVAAGAYDSPAGTPGCAGDTPGSSGRWDEPPRLFGE